MTDVQGDKPLAVGCVYDLTVLDLEGAAGQGQRQGSHGAFAYVTTPHVRQNNSWPSPWRDGRR